MPRLTEGSQPTIHGCSRALVALASVTVLGWALPAAGSEPAVALQIRPELAAQLSAAAPGDAQVVLVSGETTLGAVRAVQAAGLATVEVLDRLSLVAAVGSVEAVGALHRQPGVRRVDANLQMEFLDDVAHRATGVAQLRDKAAYPGLRPQRRPDQMPYDGTGVSIAVVDSDFDPSHEQFVENGESKFDVHLRQACPLPREAFHYFTGADPSPDVCSAWVPASPMGDDATSGHGTIVAGVAAAYPRTTPSGAGISGAGPGARLVGLSLGAAITSYNAVSALHWVLEHHADPCGDGSCPPVRVVNNSYGAPADDPGLGVSHRFDPDSPMSRATTNLIEAGVVVVFSAGNWGGNGSTNQTNWLALHPLPGMISVGAYHDAEAGDRHVAVARFSSKGKRGDASTYPDLLAPGVNYLMGCSPASELCTGTTPKDGLAYGLFSGTSISAPYLAGVVATLFEADPTLTPAAVEDILEDTAYQSFVQDGLLEPDVYTDAAGVQHGNDNHRTSFDAGHGLLDAVGALNRVLQGGNRPAPSGCPRPAETTISDPAGDTTFSHHVPLVQPEDDVIKVTASLLQHPGALTVTVRYVDVPQTEVARQYTTVEVFIDGRYAEIDLLRTISGDSFSPFQAFSAWAQVDGSVDANTDTATFVIRPVAGPVQQRASIAGVWTANRGTRPTREADYTAGTCMLWLP